MEPNCLPSGMFSNMGSSGKIGLEMSLNHQQQQPLPPQQNHPRHHHNFPVVAPFRGNHHDGAAEHRHTQPPQSTTQVHNNINNNPFASKPRNSAVSDEDEANGATEDSGDGRRKGSPWQRMKWTDSMVRLLIMVVFYIGDEVGSEGPSDPGAKKKAGSGVLQKKGKWKSVSRAMMERGFFVSPQQCEDKFNDLNKRYKRVNDILGKGTACKVVENQNLLETMDHLPPKMKEEVKKLLNSKHLFFREMCAYHNSCGGGGGSGGGGHRSPLADQSPPQQQKCLHSNEKNGIISNTRSETEVLKMASGEYEDEYDDEDAEYGDDEDDGLVERNSHNNDDHDDNDNDNEEGFSRKKPKAEMVMIQQFSGEVMGVVQDVTKSLWEKRQWMKTRLMQLEEQRVGYQVQAFELEKQRLKWVKFSCKKERDMEAEKLGNERMRLENDRMVLLLRQKELELIDLQQQQYSSNKRSDPSSVTA